MEKLNLKEKKVIVNDQTIIDRIIEDLNESDSDTLVHIIESMYPVKATYIHETGEVEMVVDEEQADENTTLENIF